MASVQKQMLMVQAYVTILPTSSVFMDRAVSDAGSEPARRPDAGREVQMSWRRIRALTLVLLVLLIAAPLSSGDKGLWLSLTATPVQLLESASDGLPAEHSILLPDGAGRSGRAATVPRPERADVAKSLGPAGAAWLPRSGERWTVVVSSPPHPHSELFAARPAPRAPPA